MTSKPPYLVRSLLSISPGKLFDCDCFFIDQHSFCESHVLGLLSLLLCGFGIFPKHSLLIPSIWQFSFDAIEFAIFEVVSCLLFAFLTCGNSDIYHTYSRWDNNQDTLGEKGILPIWPLWPSFMMTTQRLDLIMKSLFCVSSLFMPHLLLSICVNESL